jgi:hypothetical protein
MLQFCDLCKGRVLSTGSEKIPEAWFGDSAVALGVEEGKGVTVFVR